MKPRLATLGEEDEGGGSPSGYGGHTNDRPTAGGFLGGGGGVGCLGRRIGGDGLGDGHGGLLGGGFGYGLGGSLGLSLVHIQVRVAVVHGLVYGAEKAHVANIPLVVVGTVEGKAGHHLVDTSAPHVGQIHHHDEVFVLTDLHHVTLARVGVPGGLGVAGGYQLVARAVEEVAVIVEVIPQEHGEDGEVRAVVGHGIGYSTADFYYPLKPCHRSSLAIRSSCP